ncbi:MAG TPA: carboxypeptidase-like regulatory domain-containing protein [Terriglobales bacterium]|nr:carboxypeptidase-like regulatory domain-containing protein [Terriglobales bacterium]
MKFIAPGNCTGKLVNGKLMKKTIIGSSTVGMFLLVVLSAALSSTFVLAAPAPQFGRSSKQDKTRLLTGKVLDAGDNPLPNAVVYLTNTHTRSVKTYIVGPDGTYRFPALQPSIDYEVYAQYDNRKSGTKTVSQFDDRPQLYISLKVDAK